MDSQALAQLYERHAAALLLYARQWAGSAEDVVQDAFLKLSEQCREPENVRAWLFKVVRNTAISAHRAGERRRRREAYAKPDEAWFDSVDDQLDSVEAKRALTELPDELREAVVARLWGELTFEELAELVGCSRATAHRRYMDALFELRRRLESCPNTTMK